MRVMLVNVLLWCSLQVGRSEASAIPPIEFAAHSRDLKSEPPAWVSEVKASAETWFREHPKLWSKLPFAGYHVTLEFEERWPTDSEVPKRSWGHENLVVILVTGRSAEGSEVTERFSYRWSEARWTKGVKKARYVRIQEGISQLAHKSLESFRNSMANYPRNH